MTVDLVHHSQMLYLWMNDDWKQGFLLNFSYKEELGNFPFEDNRLTAFTVFPLFTKPGIKVVLLFLLLGTISN